MAQAQRLATTAARQGYHSAAFRCLVVVLMATQTAGTKNSAKIFDAYIFNSHKHYDGRLWNNVVQARPAPFFRAM